MAENVFYGHLTLLLHCYFKGGSLAEGKYKEEKAYRYFTNGFIGEVYINLLGNDSKYCIFKTKCLPSQRFNNKQYDVW